MKALLVLMLLAGGSEAVRFHEVRHEGLVFQVRGTVNQDGTIHWNPADPVNRRAWDAAKDRTPPVATTIPNFGINADRMFHGPGESFRADGAEARQFVAEVRRARDQGRPAAEDATKLHVTIIGPEAERGRVVRDLQEHPALTPLRDRILLQDYAPDDWAVDPALGFQVNGRPTILIQAHDGRVAWRAADYAVGPDGLAEAIRKADPSYRPGRDPGPANAAACPLGFTTQDWPAVIVAGTVLLLILARARKDGR